MVDAVLLASSSSPRHSQHQHKSRGPTHPDCHERRELHETPQVLLRSASTPGGVAAIEDAVSLTNIFSLSPLTTPPQCRVPANNSYHEHHQIHGMPCVLL